jgi:S1-C subfamily serine protease
MSTHLFSYYPYSYVVLRAIDRIRGDGRLAKACSSAEEIYEATGGTATWATDVKASYSTVRYATLEPAYGTLSGLLSMARETLRRCGITVSDADPVVERTLVLAAGLRNAGFHVLLLAPRGVSPRGRMWLGIASGGADAKALTPDELDRLNNDGNSAILLMDVKKLRDANKAIPALFADAFVNTPVRDGSYYYVDLNEPIASDQSVLSARAFHIWGPTHKRVGTGFFVTRDGLALTALHVVDRLGPLIQVRKGEAVDLNARVLFRNEVDDIALLRVEVGEGAGAPLTALPLCSDPGIPDDGLREVVSAYGYINEVGEFEGERPYAGRVWYKADVQFEGARRPQYVNVIARIGDASFLDAKFMIGSSGGPVINAATGTLMGMITGRRPRPSDAVAEAGYAVPIERILEVVSKGKWGVHVETLAIPVRIDYSSEVPRESLT